MYWEGGLAWLPSDPTLTLQFQGLREAQRQELSHGSRDTEVQRQMEKGRHVWPQRQRQTKSQTEKLRETCRRRQKGDRGSTSEPKHLEGGVESLRNSKTERKDTSHNEGHGMEIGIVQRQKVKEREQEIA